MLHLRHLLLDRLVKRPVSSPEFTAFLLCHREIVGIVRSVMTEASCKLISVSINADVVNAPDTEAEKQAYKPFGVRHVQGTLVHLVAQDRDDF